MPSALRGTRRGRRPSVSANQLHRQPQRQHLLLLVLQTTPKTSALPNGRKGYKLTLVVSATSEAGLADAHGMLQLDGADPVPFCRLKNVQNPLARALRISSCQVIQRAWPNRQRWRPHSYLPHRLLVARQRPVPPQRPGPRAQESPSQPCRRFGEAGGSSRTAQNKPRRSIFSRRCSN